MANASNYQKQTFEEIGPGVQVMLGFFSVIGTFGNILTLYVFARMLKQNLTSTIFILTLAGTDLVTCFFIIPSTMIMEHLHYSVTSDAWCKIYHGIMTTTVPNSAFIMAAIAVDRYICICHPFSHVMTVPRAKFTALFCTMLAVSLGAITSLLYGTYTEIARNVTINEPLITDRHSALKHNYSTGVFPVYNFSLNVDGVDNNIIPAHSDEKFYFEEKVLKNIGICNLNTLIISEYIRNIYQKFFSSIFLIVFVVVTVFYSFVYRRVLQRRRSHPHIFASYWCFCIPKSIVSSSNDDSALENGIELVSERKTLRSPSMRSPNSRADKIFLVNLKIAITLCIVTIVYIVFYLPSWLMALKLIDTNVFVFYMYFAHNVVNPIIYAFTNQNFRDDLRLILRCKTQLRPVRV